jgi:hypothetical protein
MFVCLHRRHINRSPGNTASVAMNPVKWGPAVLPSPNADVSMFGGIHR